MNRTRQPAGRLAPSTSNTHSRLAAPGCVLRALMLVALVLFPALASTADNPALNFWPQWRGPLANGVAPKATPPLEWSETKNIKWKVAIPGFGTATPIIWDNRVFVLTAIPTGTKAESAGTPPAGGGQFGTSGAGEVHQFVVLCLDRKTGKTLWQKIAREEAPHEGHHRDHGFASGSPVTDGKVVLTHFGSRGLHCYDLEGNLKWQKDLGRMTTRNSFGEGSSPALYRDTVVVLWDHEGPDFIVAFDRETGRELWRSPRDEPTGWCTPLIVEHEGKPQAIVNGTGKARSYDLATGKVIWECGGQTANAIPSAVSENGIAYVTSGFRGSALHAIRLGRTGDLTGSDAIVWSYNRSTPYVPSPLFHNGLLYVIAGNNPILSCLDARDGKVLIDAERLDGLRGIYASPVAAGDRVYVLGREGTALVLKAGPKVEVLARNTIDDKTDASIALVGSELFIRGHKSLYCIAP